MTEVDVSDQQLLDLLRASRNILITSHISPDPDAVSSALLLKRTIEANFPDKKTRLVLEEKPNRDVSFLAGYEEIKFGPLTEVVRELKPELFIIVDANKYDRVSRHGAEQIADYVRGSGVKTAVIDHHEPHDLGSVDVYINNHFPASAQEVYDLCFRRWRLKKPEDYAETALLGIVTDSFRFKYKNPKHRETFAVVSDLLDAGADIEELDNRLEHYDKSQLKAFAELAKNFTEAAGYNYTFVSDDFIDSWRADNSADDFKSAVELFANQFLRSTGANKWGFILNQEIEDAGQYHVSLRSIGDARDVSLVAGVLGGGGHKPAAGAKFKAGNLDEALGKVKDAIGQVS
jgi:bifunctional oligoribonuclease and PAP phosphatase NrnA